MTQPIDLRVLANDELAIAAAPGLGGRIVELTDISNGREWLWRNRRVPFGPVASGSAYDDVWQGGFEELFPNDAPTVVDDSSYPDHGEVWSVPWQVMHSDDHTIELAVVGPATGVRIGKRFSIEGARLIIRYSLENPGHAALPHLFKVDSQFGNLLDAVDEQPWPTSIDLSRCRDQTTRSNEFVYVSDLPEGWCGITDTKAGSWFRIDDPRDVFPYYWIFMSYGGWRYHNVVVLEPCSNYPNEAIATSKAAALAPSSITEFQLQVSVGAR